MARSRLSEHFCGAVFIISILTRLIKARWGVSLTSHTLRNHAVPMTITLPIEAKPGPSDAPGRNRCTYQNHL
jgi:hypothetical protein